VGGKKMVNGYNLVVKRKLKRQLARTGSERDDNIITDHE
jgi:hypothetical protein